MKNAPAGTLNLFNGMRSLHRVRSVYGPTTRVLAVLSYDDREGRQFPPSKNVALYGDRVKQIYHRRGVSVKASHLISMGTTSNNSKL